MYVLTYVNAGDIMGRFTVSVSEDIKQEMNSMPHINWPEIAKSAVLKKLDQLEKFDKLIRKGEL
jgi:hypothetical protein